MQQQPVYQQGPDGTYHQVGFATVATGPQLVQAPPAMYMQGGMPQTMVYAQQPQMMMAQPQVMMQHQPMAQPAPQTSPASPPPYKGKDE